MIIHNNNPTADNPGSLFVSHPLVFNPGTHDSFPLAQDYSPDAMIVITILFLILVPWCFSLPCI